MYKLAKGSNLNLLFKMKNILFTFFGIIAAIFSFGQNTFKISGTITNQNQEPLIGATVFMPANAKGDASNFNGRYEITGLENGKYILVASVLGYRTDTLFVEIQQADVIFDVQLQEQATDLQGLEVVAERITERTSISNISFGKAALQTSHGLTEDPLRTLAALPGIGRGGDLFSPSQIYVRGGAPEENLFLMDNNKIYFPYYFGGQKSIFNTDATESIELLTGGFSAAYGNHLSSVLNVKTRDGDFEQYRGMASIGFYNSAALFEGPVVKEKLSVLVAVRRTYLDLFLDESADFPVPSFGDVTYKISYNINDNHNLSLSGLSSEESINFLTAEPEPGLPNRLETGGNNHFQSLQLKSSFGSKIYNKLSLTNALSNSANKIGSNIELNIDGWQMGLRDDLTYYISNKHKLKTGIEWQYGSIDFMGNLPLDPLQTDPNDTTIVLRNFNIHDKGESIRSAYILYDGNPFPKLGINAGIRLDQNPRRNYTDFSPRLAVNYQLTEKSKIRFSTGIFHQFPESDREEDLISNKAIHYILGYEYRFSNQLYGWIEAYHKDYQDLVYYDEQLRYSNDGEGMARGIELFLRKEKGDFRGWIAYSFSHSERRIPLLDEVEDFEFDQRHILNVVAEYHLKLEEHPWYIPTLFQANFRYADGTPYTPVVGAENFGAGWMPIQGEPLSVRNSDYQNLNLRVEWSIKIGKKGRGTSFMEVWNLLNAKNILGRSYQYGNEFPNNFTEQPYYTASILPAGGFRVEF